MKIVLCSAHYNEINRVIRYFKAKHIETLKKKYSLFHYINNHNEIYFIITGMGKKNTKRYLSYFQDKYDLDRSYSWILTGFCGSLIKSDKIGRVIVPCIIRDTIKKYVIKIFPKIKKSKKEGLFCVDKIFGLQDKIQLKKEYNDISAVDMESMAFCETMQDRKMKEYFIYKSVSDDLDFIFPDFRLLKGSMLYNLKMCIYFLFRDFKQIIYLKKIIKNINIASKTIFRFFLEYYEEYQDK